MVHPEMVGLGYKQDVESKATFEQLWNVFVMKVHHPDRFLPVTHVKTRENADGSVYREMTMGNGQVLVEDIYMDKEKGEIRFVLLDADGNATDVEHVNVLHRGAPMQIEYYQRKVGGERLHWDVPRQMVVEAIRRQIELSTAQT